jgi:hypothetical protein
MFVFGMLNVRFERKTAYGFVKDAVDVFEGKHPGYVSGSLLGFLTGSDVRTGANPDEGAVIVRGVHIPDQRVTAWHGVYDESVRDQARQFADVEELAGIVIYRPGNSMLVESDMEKRAREDFAEQGWPAWSLMVNKDSDFAFNL